MGVSHIETGRCSGQRHTLYKGPDIFESTESLGTAKNFCVTLGLEEKKPER